MGRVLIITMTGLLPGMAYAAGGDTGHALKLLGYAAINFTIFVALILWKVRPAAHKYAELRHDEITDEIRKVEQERERLQNELDSANSKRAQADADAQQLKQDIAAAAKAQADKMITNAKQQVESAERSTQQQISAAQRQAQLDLLEQAAALLVENAASGMQSKIDSAKNDKIVNQKLAQIGA